VSTESAIATRKLRTIMRDRGFQALPPEAKVVGPTTGRPPAAETSAPRIARGGPLRHLLKNSSTWLERMKFVKP
jgi:hypothetical protein